jgi:hypothetical protein
MVDIKDVDEFNDHTCFLFPFLVKAPATTAIGQFSRSKRQMMLSAWQFLSLTFTKLTSLVKIFPKPLLFLLWALKTVKTVPFNDLRPVLGGKCQRSTYKNPD